MNEVDQAGHGSRKRILLVEDHSRTRFILLNQLNKAGLDVELASNGPMALKKISEMRVDAVILDLMIPGIKGVDLIKEVRKKKGLGEIPIFVCTSAVRMDVWRKRGTKAGATKIYDKASTPVETIVAEVVTHLKGETRRPAPAAAPQVDRDIPNFFAEEDVIMKPSPVTPAAKVEAKTEKPVAQPPPIPAFARARDPVPAAPAPVSFKAETPVASDVPKVTVDEPESEPAFESDPEPVSTAMSEPLFEPQSEPEPEVEPEAVFSDLKSSAGEETSAARIIAPLKEVAAFSVDDDGKIVTTQEGAASLFGWTSGSLAGQDLGALLKPGSETELKRFLRGEGGDTFSAWVIARHRDNAEFPASLTLSKSWDRKASWTAVFGGVTADEHFAALPQEPVSSRTSNSKPENTPSARQLQEQLAAITAERDALVSLLGDQPLVRTGGDESPEQLEEAHAAVSRAEAAYQAEAERSRRFEQELARLQQARDELNRKLEQDEQERAESKRRSEELEQRLAESMQEQERLKADLDQHVVERASLEAELRDQLSSAKESAEKAELSLQEEAERLRQSNSELQTLRNARDELNARLEAEHRAAEESRQRSEELEKQLHERVAELERLAALLEKQVSERGSVESALSNQLKAAKAAAERAEAAFKEEATRGSLFASELARLTRAREELNHKLAEEERVAEESRKRSEELEQKLAQSASELERVKAELERHTAERVSAELQLRDQLNAAKEAADKAKHDYTEETSFFTRSTEELAALRRVRDELNARLAAERQTTAALESELGQQLKAANEAAKKAEAAYKQEAARRARFEQELDKLRKFKPEGSKSKGEAKAAVSARRRIKELEDKLEESGGELKRVKSELDRQVGERTRLESEYQNLSKGSASLGQQVSRLCDSRAPVEGRVRESVSALARATADLEKERSQRRQLEQRVAFLTSQLQNLHEELRRHLEVEKVSQDRIAEIEQLLREREETLNRANADLEKEIADRQLAEAQLQASGEVGSQLKQQFSLLDEAKAVFKRAQEELEARLEVTARELDAAQGKLQKSNGEKQRLQTSLADAQRQLQEQKDQSALELKRLESTLRVEALERRRLEGQAIHSQYASLDSARLRRAFVNSYRGQLRTPTDTLMASIRQLLELSLDEEPKKRVENVLENALMLQTTLQDDSLGADATESSGAEHA